uniref:non-specific serine/threonine protein kinase n=1 Tax=Kalanchoe fedtschenkoi TaxID=63787 RepID=A0A7N0TJY8_KALFE
MFYFSIKSETKIHKILQQLAAPAHISMKLKPSSSSTNNFITTITIFSVCFFCHVRHLHSQSQEPSTVGYSCDHSTLLYPCQTYVFYKPTLTDLASVADIFSMSRLMISRPSNISDPSSPLVPGQSLFIPITCSCNPVNASYSISYAPINYTFNAQDSMYIVSTNKFHYLTTFQSVQLVNPLVVPTNIDVGAQLIFPIFCKCPNKTLVGNQTNFLVSYVFQTNDTLDAVASSFGTSAASIALLNGNNPRPLDTIFVPVSKLPNISQPLVSPNVTNTNTTATGGDDNQGLVTGLTVGLSVCGLLLVLAIGILGCREAGAHKRRKKNEEVDKMKQEDWLLRHKGGSGLAKDMEVSLMADVSDCLDKYRVFKMDELRIATNGFDENNLVQGSVYKGCIDGEIYAVKKMKWNAYDELKILQKVNHGNLVRLEGFCIDPEDSTCYLIYEYIENESLYWWLHNNVKEKLSWKTRLRIALDVANGLQYIHEHTRPRVVHKDIKSSNILLDGSMRAKIANFGLAKSGCNAITRHIVGTQGYISPEYLSDGVITTKMDVFAFGVILLELISGKEALCNMGFLRSEPSFLHLNIQETTMS